MGVLVIPDSFALGAAHQAFDAEGGLKDANVEKAVRGIGAALTATVVNIGHSTASASPRRTLGLSANLW